MRCQGGGDDEPEVGLMLLRAMVILMLGVGAAMAQEAVVPVAAVAGSGQALPEKAMKKLRGAPDVFLRDAAELIYGFGRDGGIDLAGIDAFVAAERARFRAKEMARYLAADINNDGDVGRDEMAALADAAAAGKRGGLQLGYDRADADGDGVLGLTELRGYAQGVAMVQMSDADVDEMRGILMFDADGDGVAAMEEVAAGVSALVAAD
jgi:hypothetical protein